MPRFVLLHHQTVPGAAKPPHFDFMLEMDGIMRTWNMMQEPLPGVTQTATLIHDHRLDYFDFEGDLTENRGTMRRCDRGDYSIMSWADEEIVVQLVGGSLVGQVKLTRLGVDSKDWDFVWLEGK